MARNRQRARDRKAKNRDDGNGLGPVDDAAPDELAEPTLADAAEDAELEYGGGGDGDGDSDGDSDASLDREQVGGGAGDVATTKDARPPSGFRLVNFFRACWAELQRVQWPDRRQVGQATAVVLGFVVVAGAFLGLADIAAEKLVELIL